MYVASSNKLYSAQINKNPDAGGRLVLLVNTQTALFKKTDKFMCKVVQKNYIFYW